MGSTTSGSTASKGQMFLLPTTSASGLKPIQPPLYKDTGCLPPWKILRKMFGPIKESGVWEDPHRPDIISEIRKGKITMARTCRRNVRRKMCEECFYTYAANQQTHTHNICSILYHYLPTCCAIATTSVVQEY